MLEPARLLVRPGGELVIVGTGSVPEETSEAPVRCGPGTSDLLVVRVRRNGSLAGTSALEQERLDGCVDFVGTAALAPEGLLVGAILFIRWIESSQVTRSVVARFLPSGDLNTDFGHDGVFEWPASFVPFGLGIVDSVGRIYEDDNDPVGRLEAPDGGQHIARLGGRLFLLGLSGRDTYALWGVRGRRLDRAFGRNGEVEVLFASRGTGGATLYDLDIAAGRAIYTFGSYETRHEDYGKRELRYFVYRHRLAGPVDRRFGNDGRIIVRTGLKHEVPIDMDVDPRGRPLVIGQFEQAGKQWVFLARYTRRGARDDSFGEGGLVKLRLGKANLGPYREARAALAVQPDGKIVVVASISPQPPVVARFLDDGRLDRSFGRRGRVILPRL